MQLKCAPKPVTNNATLSPGREAGAGSTLETTVFNGATGKLVNLRPPDARFNACWLPLDLRGGTAFQQAVWRALLAIPRGQTLSYGALAQRIGKPAAVRAVGAAVGRNPASIVVPCHRVLGQGGALTGYAGGLARKTALLRLEGALA